MTLPLHYRSETKYLVKYFSYFYLNESFFQNTLMIAYLWLLGYKKKRVTKINVSNTNIRKNKSS